MTGPKSRRIGFLLYSGVTQLDLTGPYEVLAGLPGAELLLVAQSRDAVRSESGLVLTPDTTFDDAPALDLIVIPGGPGVDALLEDAETLAFIRRAAARATYVTSVCTGALLLGAAGLLKGKRAATHWNAKHFLEQFGATAVDERVVVDGCYITGGGVTAGIDIALRLVIELAGRSAAELIQLGLEYDPAPPVDAGTPKRAGPACVRAYQAHAQPRQDERRRAVEAAVRAL